MTGRGFFDDVVIPTPESNDKNTVPSTGVAQITGVSPSPAQPAAIATAAAGGTQTTTAPVPETFATPSNAGIMSITASTPRPETSRSAVTAPSNTEMSPKTAAPGLGAVQMMTPTFSSATAAGPDMNTLVAPNTARKPGFQKGSISKTRPKKLTEVDLDDDVKNLQPPNSESFEKTSTHLKSEAHFVSQQMYVKDSDLKPDTKDIDFGKGSDLHSGLTSDSIFGPQNPQKNLFGDMFKPNNNKKDIPLQNSKTDMFSDFSKIAFGNFRI
jgi:hypothetical protein